MKLQHNVLVLIALSVFSNVANPLLLWSRPAPQSFLLYFAIAWCGPLAFVIASGLLMRRLVNTARTVNPAVVDDVRVWQLLVAWVPYVGPLLVARQWRRVSTVVASAVDDPAVATRASTLANIWLVLQFAAPVLMMLLCSANQQIVVGDGTLSFGVLSAVTVVPLLLVFGAMVQGMTTALADFTQAPPKLGATGNDAPVAVSTL